MASSSRIPPQSINVNSEETLSNKPKTTSLQMKELRLVIEQPVDFESLRVNNYNLQGYFRNQEWMDYFEMLNGDVYPTLVKDFWLRAEVFDSEAARKELQEKIEEDPDNNKGKTRAQLGLEPFSGTIIRSSVMGLKARITRSDFAQLLNVPNAGKFLVDTDKGKSKVTKYRDEIKELLFDNKTDYGKSTNMHMYVRMLFKIITSSIVPRVGSSDQISWDLKHVLLFLVKGEKINLPAYLFHFLCIYIKNTKEKNTALVAYPRLLSELFYQCGLIERLKEVQDPMVNKTVRGKFFTAEVLVNMGKLKKKDLVYPNKPLTKEFKPRPLIDNIPQVYKIEPLDVILEHIRQMREAGQEITMDDIQSEPEDEYSKKRKRTLKKKKSEDKEEGAEKPKKKKKAVKISVVEEKSEEKGASQKDKDEAQEPYVTQVLEDSESSDDDFPLTKRPKKKESGHEASTTGSEQGIPKPSVNISDIAQDLPSSTTQDQTFDDIDDTQPISIMLPGSSQVLPALPKSLSSSPSTHELEHAKGIMDTLTNLRQAKIAEINELTQQYTNLQPQSSPPQDSDSLNILEQHYNGEFEQAIHSSFQNPDIKMVDPEIIKYPPPETTHFELNPPTSTNNQSAKLTLASDTEPRFTLVLNPEPPISTRPFKPIKISLSTQPSHSEPEESFSVSEEPESSSQTLPPPPPISDPQLEQFSRDIYKKVKELHSMRYSFVDPYAYIHAWDKIRDEIMDVVYKVVDGDLQELIDYQKRLQGWVNLVNAEVDQARLRKLGQLSLTDHQHWNEIILKDHIYSLSSDLSRHLKFSMVPGPLFVPKEAFEHPGFEEFKAKVEKELAEQRVKQAVVDSRLERIENKQDAIAADLKNLISLLSSKP
ncbi:hypothetical protein A2U01_0000037 [Trifolium medium]|uniref:Envelope-like protein n=1 Tax=Trifolium medium TaxID=97028 RepID=A0A392LWE3_9FABA|nr:hypothetical protein [Trifolium medium]